MQGTLQDTRHGVRIKGSHLQDEAPRPQASIDPDLVEAWLRAHARSVDPGVAQRVRIVARLYGGEWLSGQTLARQLGISRAAVHKHVEILRGLGMDLASATGVGHRLAVPPSDIVAAEGVLPLMAAGGLGSGLPYRFEPTIASTNAAAREEGSAGAPHGAVVVTDYQHTGRGRLGRTWVSEPGMDLTFSLVLRPQVPPERASRLTLAVSVAVALTLIEREGLAGRVTIKWPNDVLLDGRKVCGILSEASLDMDRLHWVVVGVGLNVNGAPGRNLDRVETAESPADGAEEAAAGAAPAPPVSLREAVGRFVERAPLLVGLLEGIDRWVTRASGDGWGEVLDGFRRLDGLRGGPVEVRTGGGRTGLVVEGIAEGVGPEGELLVRDRHGDVRAVLSGDVTLRPSRLGSE